MAASKLLTWTNRNDKIDVNSEIEFLRECEKNCNISIIGRDRFLNVLRFLKNIKSSPLNILDVGGNQGTALWLSAKFPGAKVSILNTSTEEIGSWKSAIKANAENFKSKVKYDIIFIGDVLEHTYNPDGVIASCTLVLNKNGYLILSTPNLACIYNRIFLLFGWSPGGYYPSLRYMVGNPFFKNKIGEFGIIVDHKSVFTWKGLIELLSLYDLRVLKSYGFDVVSSEKDFKMPAKGYQVLNQNFRVFMSHLLHKSLKPGMMFICQSIVSPDKKKIAGGILEKNIWDYN